MVILITEWIVLVNFHWKKEEKNLHLSLQSPSAMFPLEFTEK